MKINYFEEGGAERKTKLQVSTQTLVQSRKGCPASSKCGGSRLHLPPHLGQLDGTRLVLAAKHKHFSLQHHINQCSSGKQHLKAHHTAKGLGYCFEGGQSVSQTPLFKYFHVAVPANVLGF
jgi:hypothetical protein